MYNYLFLTHTAEPAHANVNAHIHMQVSHTHDDAHTHAHTNVSVHASVNVHTYAIIMHICMHIYMHRLCSHLLCPFPFCCCHRFSYLTIVHPPAYHLIAYPILPHHIPASPRSGFCVSPPHNHRHLHHNHNIHHPHRVCVFLFLCVVFGIFQCLGANQRIIHMFLRVCCWYVIYSLILVV